MSEPFGLCRDGSEERSKQFQQRSALGSTTLGPGQEESLSWSRAVTNTHRLYSETAGPARKVVSSAGLAWCTLGFSTESPASPEHPSVPANQEG